MTAYFAPGPAATHVCDGCDDHQGPLFSVRPVHGVTVTRPHHDTSTAITVTATAAAPPVPDDVPGSLQRHGTLLAAGVPHIVRAVDVCTWRLDRPCPAACACTGPRPPEINVLAVWLHHMPHQLAKANLTGTTLDLWHRLQSEEWPSDTKKPAFEHQIYWNVIGHRTFAYPSVTNSVAIELDIAAPLADHPPLPYGRLANGTALFRAHHEYSIGITGFGPPDDATPDDAVPFTIDTDR